MQPPGDITSWVYKAEEDYRTATTMVRKRKEIAPDNVCFCAQQCVEKYLKAFLILHRVPFPKTHDLDALLDRAVELDGQLESLRPDAVRLNPYAVQFRYPGNEATIAESKEAVRMMKRLRAVLREKLGVAEEGI